MGETVFRFKRFEVRNAVSSMKVNTDGVLLGAAVTLTGRDVRILDAGTGTGTIALMLAQRCHDLGTAPSITGIDIDRPSAEEAAANFAASPWTETLKAENIALQQCRGRFDLIVSNPPYYDSSLQNPDARKSTARHMAGKDEDHKSDAPLSYRNLLEFCGEHLEENGHLAMILPADMETAVLRTARGFGMYADRILRIRTVPHKKPARFIAEFSRQRPGDIAEEELTIQENGRWTEEYTGLMKEFYLWA